MPELARVVMAGFDSVRDCANAVADIIEAGINSELIFLTQLINFFQHIC
jgi:hypothetical protein